MKKNRIIRNIPLPYVEGAASSGFREDSPHLMNANLNNHKNASSLFGWRNISVLSLTFNSLTFCFFLLITSSCKKNNTNIPDIYVDQYLYLSQPSNINLNAVGGFIYLNNVGARGLIVYRKSISEFVALDRNCTFDPNQACATVIVDNTNFFADDTCCHSRFQINSGQVVNGPASLPLKAYQTEFDGVSVLHIFN